MGELVRFLNLITIFFVLNNSLFAKETLTFNSNEKFIAQKIASLVLKKLIPESEMLIDIVPVPPSRANLQNTKMAVDGEVARISNYTISNSSLYRVDPPYYYIKSIVLCRQETIGNFSKVEGLKKFKVVITRGVTHAEDMFKKHKNLFKATSVEQMYKMLMVGRVDLVIDTSVSGAFYRAQEKYASVKECGELARHDLHVYLNSKSKRHIEFISKQIKASIKDKSLYRHWAEAESFIINNK